MELVKRVFSTFVSTIVPDSFKERNTTRKRTATDFEPELTDDEENSDYFNFSIRKRMRSNLNDGPSTSAASRALLDKSLEMSSTREREMSIAYPRGLGCNGEIFKRTGVRGDTSSSGAVLTSRKSMFNGSSSHTRDQPRQSRFNWGVTLKKPMKSKPRNVFEQFKKNHYHYASQAATSTRADIIRLDERSKYVKLINDLRNAFPRMNSSNTSSKPSTSEDSGRSSQAGVKPLVQSKVPLGELTALWSRASADIVFQGLSANPLGTMRALNYSGDPLPLPETDRPPNKVIDTIDISRDSESDDSVICESPVSTPKPPLKSPLYKSTPTSKIESLGDHIRAVLDRSLGDIDKPIVLDDEDEKESTVNSSEKENDEETESHSSLLNRSCPINSLALDFQTSEYTKPNWLTDQKTSYADSKRNREERIKYEETKLKILRNESTLDKDLSQIVRRNLTLTDIIVLEEPEEELQLPEITENMRHVINLARSGRNLSDVITTTPNNIDITRADIRSLAPMQWLNDNVINAYMDMIALRSKSQDKWPKVHVFTTFFYPKYLNEGYSNILKRWTRKVDIFSFDLLIFPIHLGIHWCLAAADLRKKIIKYYDSLGGKNFQCPKALLQYLGKEHHERKKTPLGDHQWITEVVDDIPQQQNGSDCGMFACKFAEYLSRDAELNFKQEDMNYYRDRMIYEIIQQDLLYP